MTIKDILKNNFSDLKYTILRFPLAILSAILLTIVTIYGNFQEEITYRYTVLLAVFTVGIFLFIFISLLNSFLQTVFNKAYYKYLTNLLGIVILIGLYYFGKNSNLTNYIYPSVFFIDLLYLTKKFGTIVYGLIVFFIVSSLYIEKLNNPRGTDIYIYKIIRAIGISVIFSIVILVGTQLILYALSILFFDFIDYRYFMSNINLIMILVNLIVFLSNYPKASIYEDYIVPKFFKKLLINIVVVLLIIFGLILYIYFAMILIQRRILVRQIAYLVIVYGGFTIGTLMLLNIVDNNKFKTTYMKIAPISIIPLLGMLFYSMGGRINNYGVTENRYFVVLIGLWLLFSSIYFIVNKYKNNLPVLMVFSLLTLIGTVGPLSAYNISTRSQKSRLEYYLNKNNMLQDEKLVPNSDVSKEDKLEITNILEYFIYNKDEKELPYIVEIGDDFTLDTGKYLGFDFYYSYEYEMEENPEPETGIGISYQPDKVEVDNIEEYKHMDLQTVFNNSIIGDYTFVVKDDNLEIHKNEEIQAISFDEINEKINTSISSLEFELEFSDGKIKILFYMINASSNEPESFMATLLLFTD
ncbi:DUF4153 domain-containing protein [Miniphocaeibacter halophilus]|uniref:DUF4153 domain-containing protein n=1 Tax=Miniphocaeibacter halophilus TaxID=2931922 RepID=A0AC61MZR4_9FIRM|nr:DUF4153 domain-containing protein [Miniphocaeibacter halophilus]QQK08955.1 DUF4153 domain-containing protein [Miniphocaeibacter halophilus]